MQICGNSGLPIAMVLGVHQINDYIKRKLRVWRAQKCNFLVGAKIVPTSTGLQTTRFMQRCIGPIMEICGKSGLLIAMVLGLYQFNDYIKRKLWVWRAQKCNFLVGAKTVPTGTGVQTTPFHAAP